MYGQLTTGRPAKIVSKIHANEPANYYELKINTRKNTPEIVKEANLDWEKEHGTRIELDIEASYQGGMQSVDQYLKETAIVNPHLTIIYTNPKAQQMIFPRAIEKMPKRTAAIKPHPYGVELGVLMDMMKVSPSKTMQGFLTSDFSRVGVGSAKQILEHAAILPRTNPRRVTREMAEKLIDGIKKTRIMSPPTDCIAPIGKEQIEKGLKKEINAEFYTACTRPPNVYRGNPFIVEAGIAYGGDQQAEGSVTLMRFANRVPLLYQQGACASSKSIVAVNWRPYGLSQSTGAIPQGPCTIMVHIASVWVPFTSESKEAIAHYPEIIKEIKLALFEVGRQLGSYLNKKKRVNDELKKRSYIEKYIPHVSSALKDILGLQESSEKAIEVHLKELLEKKRGKVEDLKFDPTKNREFDADYATKEKTDEEAAKDEQE
jgi:DNA topoisomerase-6 subunit B